MKICKITNRHILFTVPEKGGLINLGLILGKNHNFIIDTGMGANSVNPILGYLDEDDKPIIVVNTHHDIDHVLGNYTLKNHTIISHILCRELMNDENWINKFQEYISENQEYIDGEMIKYLPNLIFDSSICFPEDNITIFHTPGHTKDSISVYDYLEKALYVGDNFGISEDTAYLWGENIIANTKVVESYALYDVELCIPSHSEPYKGNVNKLLEVALQKENINSLNLAMR
jgi:glyoxylase-like metal-dependent hydrolase (beta-lactamase superfamily II)